MAGRVQLSVYDVTGAKVVDLVDRHRGTGEFDAMWNGTGADGRRVAQGVYFAVLRADGQFRARKITLIR